MEPSNLKDKIQQDMKAALRSGEKETLAAIRLILAAIKQREIDERITLTDEQILSVLNKMIKQRRDAANQFKTANRPDLVQKEEQEISVIQNYMPAQLSTEKINQLIDQAFAETGAKDIADMGKIMAKLKLSLQGRADLSLVSKEIKNRLKKQT